MKHFAHFETAWQIIKDYPIFGVGNSKFRFENPTSKLSKKLSMGGPKRSILLTSYSINENSESEKS